MTKLKVDYFMEEMDYLLKEGGKFADKYPKVAESLGISMHSYADPGLSRLVESFAFLTGRISEKIDFQQEQMQYMLMELLSPALLYDIPSAGVLRFNINKQNSRIKIPKRTKIQNSSSGSSSNLSNRAGKSDVSHDETIYLTSVSDLLTTTAQISDTQLAYGMDYSMSQTKLLKLTIKNIDTQKIKVFINAPLSDASKIYHILTKADEIYVSKTLDTNSINNKTGIPSQIKINPEGFENGNTLFDLPNKHDKCDLIDFMILPEKYLFLNIELDDRTWVDIRSKNSSNNNALEILVPFPEECLKLSEYRNLNIKKDTLQTNCICAVNLFEKSGTPLKVDSSNISYPITSMNNNWAIHSISGFNNYDLTGSRNTKYEHYFEYTNASDKKNLNSYLITKKAENFEAQFILNQFDQKQDLFVGSKNAVVLPQIRYYNKFLNHKERMEWFLDQSIADISAMNVINFSQVKSLSAGKDKSEVLSVYGNIIHNIKAKLDFSLNSHHDQDLLLRKIASLMQSLSFLAEYDYSHHLKKITSKEQIVYKSLNGIMCAVPGLHYNIVINSKAIGAYLFGSILGEMLRKMSSLNKEIRYSIELD